MTWSLASMAAAECLRGALPVTVLPSEAKARRICASES